jgi:hypothetical protein
MQKNLTVNAIVLVLIGISFVWGCGGGEETISSDGGTYTGQVVNGVPHDYGVWEHPEGAMYEGKYKDGRRSGRAHEPGHPEP